MGSRKYVKDYTIVEDYDPVRKKLKTSAVYTGKYYGFVHADEIGKVKALYLTLSAVIFLSYVGILFVNAPCSHIWYTMVPLAFLMLPLIFLAASALRLLQAGEKMTREHRDKVTDRYRTVTLFQTVLTGMAIIGHIVYSFRVGDTGRDLLYYLFSAVIFAASFFLLYKRGLIETTELPEEKPIILTEEESGDSEENARQEG